MRSCPGKWAGRTSQRTLQGITPGRIRHQCWSAGLWIAAPWAAALSWRTRPQLDGLRGLARRAHIHHCSTGCSCRSCGRSAFQSHRDPLLLHPANPQVRVQYPSYPSYPTITLIEIYLYIYGGPLHEIYIRDPYKGPMGTARWWIWWILPPDLRVRCEIAMDRRWIWWIYCYDLQ